MLSLQQLSRPPLSARHLSQFFTAPVASAHACLFSPNDCVVWVCPRALQSLQACPRRLPVAQVGGPCTPQCCEIYAHALHRSCSPDHPCAPRAPSCSRCAACPRRRPNWSVSPSPPCFVTCCTHQAVVGGSMRPVCARVTEAHTHTRLVEELTCACWVSRGGGPEPPRTLPCVWSASSWSSAALAGQEARAEFARCVEATGRQHNSNRACLGQPVSRGKNGCVSKSGHREGFGHSLWSVL